MNNLVQLTLKAAKRAAGLYFSPMPHAENNNKATLPSTPAAQKKYSWPNIRTLIGNNLELTGDIAINTGSIRIDGKLNGDLHTIDGMVVIGKDATIIGNVSGSYVIIYGTVRGCVRASVAVELLATGSVFGNVTSPTVEMNIGAAVHGSLWTAESADPAIFSALQRQAHASLDAGIKLSHVG